jgi:hypothetical protein
MAGEPADGAVHGEVQGEVQEALFPSPRLRAIPSFSFDFPVGWELEEGTTAIAAIHPPEPVDGFWINVLVEHSRVEAAVDLHQAAIITYRQLARQHADVRLVTERMAHFDGGRRETYLRVVETRADGPGSEALTQLHALFFAPRVGGARTADLFQIIGTGPSDASDAYGMHVIDIVKSFRFETGPRV